MWPMVSFCQRVKIKVSKETDAGRASTIKIDLLKRDEVRDFQLPTGIREMINEKFKINPSDQIRSCFVDIEEIEPVINCNAFIAIASEYGFLHCDVYASIACTIASTAVDSKKVESVESWDLKVYSRQRRQGMFL